MANARATFLAALLATALASTQAASQSPSHADSVLSALNGCLRVHSVWRAQFAIDSQFRGDSAGRVAALLRDVYRPHPTLWEPVVGPSEAGFLEQMVVADPLHRDPRQALVPKIDYAARVLEANQRIAALTRRPVPCAEWFVYFGPGMRMHGEKGWSALDLRYVFPQPGKDQVADMLSEAITRRIYRESRRGDPDSGRVVHALLEEGVVTYVTAIDRNRGLSPREALDVEEPLLRSALRNEARLWDIVQPDLRSRGGNALGRLAQPPGIPGLYRADRIIGFRIVEAYVARHGADSWRDFFTKPSMELVQASGYDARLGAKSVAFRITTNEFWLNLHHFLYVLGRAQGGASDASRDAVSQAPVEAARVLARLDSADRATWQAAVNTYAELVSKRDLVFDSRLSWLTNGLAGAEVSSQVPISHSETTIREALRLAAPIYKDGWWPEHEVANRRWAESMMALVEQHGDKALAYIRRAYGMAWPTSGYPVRAVAYANWAGAYSTRPQLLVISSMAPRTQGLHGMETLFHEAMHQWDDSVITIIGQQANRAGVSAPTNLSHAMIFFTAGEAVRHSVPGHVPYAERFGLWPSLGTNFHDALVELWKPYLEGRGERNEVVGAMVRRIFEANRAR